MMTTKAKWVIHQYLLDRALPTGRPNLAQALTSLGYEIAICEYESGMKEPAGLPLWENECVIGYGSHQFINSITRARRGTWQPGSYHRVENLSYSGYSPYLGDVLLNDDFVLLPYGEFRRRGVRYWGKSVHIRPDAVTKGFTGFIIKEDDFKHETNSLERLSKVQPTDIVAISSPKKILGEFRFIIADRKVVTGSGYNWDNILDVRSDVHPACQVLAEEIAQRDWQADRVYTCDVCLAEIDGVPVPKVLELNAFSCSGLYACDTIAIAKAVSDAAEKEFLGED